MSPLDLLLEPLGYAFMQRALLTALIAGVVCAVLSCWLVLIGWSLLGDAVSHAVLPGVVLAYIAGAPFAIGAAVFGFLAVGLIGAIRDQGRIKEDAAIGIVFTTLFALGLVLISVTPSQTDLNHIVFGNLLGVALGDLLQVAVIGAVVLVVLLLKRRDFTLYAFDPGHAHALGLRPRLLGSALLALLALTAVVALQVVGVVLVVAMLIIPGATARLLTDRFGRMLLLAPAVAVLAALLGVYASYWLDTATGATIVLAQGALFALAWLLGPRHGLLRAALARRGGRVRRSRPAADPAPGSLPAGGRSTR